MARRVFIELAAGIPGALTPFNIKLVMDAISEEMERDNTVPPIPDDWAPPAAEGNENGLHWRLLTVPDGGASTTVASVIAHLSKFNPAEPFGVVGGGGLLPIIGAYPESQADLDKIRAEHPNMGSDNVDNCVVLVVE